MFNKTILYIWEEARRQVFFHEKGGRASHLFKSCLSKRLLNEVCLSLLQTQYIRDKNGRFANCKPSTKSVS